MPEVDGPSRGTIGRALTIGRTRVSGTAPWRKWGPYLSERQWGTVREDYSENGDAWNYFPHDHARSRAYHWGEDGLAGFSDLKQRLCFALALWNGNDPILKERLFGLTNGEGNHGEDVKEYVLLSRFHADPLVHEVAVQVSARGVPVRRSDSEQCPPLAARLRIRADRHRRLQRGPLFRRGRRIRQVVCRRNASSRSPSRTAGPETAPIHVLPTLWFRNTWSWWPGQEQADSGRREGPARHEPRRGVPPRARRSLVVLRRRAVAAVYGERDQHRAARSRRPTRPRS